MMFNSLLHDEKVILNLVEPLSIVCPFHWNVSFLLQVEIKS